LQDHSDEDEEDPFNSLGFGVVEFLRMIKHMMWLFLLFSVLMIPAIYIYAKNDGLVGLSNYSQARFTVGNFGFSTDNC